MVDGIRRSKLPSALTNPEIQWGYKIMLLFISEIFTGLWKGNSDFNIFDKPKFIDAFKFINLFKPSIVKCSLLFTSFIVSLNNDKSLAFLVNKGYFSKWRIN